ncbi:MAG: hypothetical protein JG772_123 [Dysgonamonadaceae bacterium]|jgi:hypothetical protein|nr:hypothetical protein [Dysgonamonadaceae bacterium]
MKYSDFITLQDYFHPVFNLQNEANGYWKQFIPTMQFYNLLGKTMDAVSSNIPANRKSIWVKGTFGTGKSHAGAVVKHLLCSDWDEIADYIEDRILLAEFKSRLLNFRKSKRFFPIVLKGTENGKIYDIRSFRLSLERIIKENLRKTGYNLTVKSDYERAIEYLESTPIDINAIIKNEPELRSYAKTKEDIINKLRFFDTDVYLALEEALAKPQYSVYFTSNNLGQWLSEIEKEIVNNNIADGLLIIWDEFTSIMDTITSGMTDMMQGLAEKTEKQNIYFYLISHRNSNAYNNADIERMEGRFHIVQYNMETLTTYRIMAATIRILDEQQYHSCQSDRMEKHIQLISYLTENDNQQSFRDVKNLFPLHPYSAFICSTIANQIGSANRTVMQFMYDRNNGFLGFLNNENSYNNKQLLTADKIWDYFLDEFTDDTVKYGIVTQTYLDKNKIVAELGLNYEKVFKGILLLNAMRLIVENADKIIPSTKNIKYLFEGEDFENQLDEILEYFDKNHIVQRDPSDRFLIAFASLPQDEINRAIRDAESHYSDIIKIIGYDDKQNKDTIKGLLEGSLIRQPSFVFLSCSYDNYLLRSYIKTAFRESYTLNVALLFAMDIAERNKMQETIKELANTNDYKNVIFVLFDEVFENNGRQKSRFYYYVATASVARNHNSHEPQKVNEKNAKDIINQWIIGLSNGTATVYFRDSQEAKSAKNIAKHINESIINKIFSNGVELLLSLRKSPLTFWETFKNPSKASIEPMLVSSNREEAEHKFRAQYTPAKLLFKDDNDNYIVDTDLKLKTDAPPNHPLVLIQKKVDEIFDKIKNDNRSTFNLGTELQVLTQPPFGLYTNIPNMAILAFAMRKYINDLNGVDLGTPIDSNNMRDKVVEIFNYWKSGTGNNKLNVRFGSKEEKDLKDLLIGIFDMKHLSDVPELTSLKNVRWGIIGYCKQKSKLPLWCLKYSPAVTTDDFRSLIDQIVELVQKDELKEDIVKKVLKTIEQHKFEFSRILLNSTAFEEGLKIFVQSKVAIKEEWWNEFKEYLYHNLQGEIGFWKESDVENAVLRFHIEKTKRPESPQPPIQDPTPQLPIPQQTMNNPEASLEEFFRLNAEKVSRVKDKVAKASNTSPIIWKNILLQILDNFPQTADIIDENLE